MRTRFPGRHKGTFKGYRWDEHCKNRVKAWALDAERETNSTVGLRGERGSNLAGLWGPCEEELGLYPETHRKPLEATATGASGGNCWFPWTILQWNVGDNLQKELFKWVWVELKEPWKDVEAPKQSNMEKPWSLLGLKRQGEEIVRAGAEKESHPAGAVVMESHRQQENCSTPVGRHTSNAPASCPPVSCWILHWLNAHRRQKAKEIHWDQPPLTTRYKKAERGKNGE